MSGFPTGGPASKLGIDCEPNRAALRLRSNLKRHPFTKYSIKQVSLPLDVPSASSSFFRVASHTSHRRPNFYTTLSTNTSAAMADVEMTDAPPKNKTSKAGGAGDAEGKKRFEIKKVGSEDNPCWDMPLMIGLVERCRALGVGYRSRQLCDLSKPHHGSLCVYLSIWRPFQD